MSAKPRRLTLCGEPNLFNPTDIDIDHLGRVWVCEAVNYRHFANKGVIGDKGDKGDRIVIVEDSDHDGKADKTQVFFQGHEVDSAHGICVLPTPRWQGPPRDRLGRRQGLELL